MAAVRDTAEASGALRRTEVTLGLHSAEDGFFHVLSPGRHALGKTGCTPYPLADVLVEVCSLALPPSFCSVR